MSFGLPELFFVVIFFVGPAVLNAYLARNKGRSVTSWIVGGLIFSLLSTLVLVALGKPGK